MTQQICKPGRPRDQDLDQLIIEATLALMAQHGYTRMTMDEIAAEARVNKAAIYRRYPSKEVLAVEALAHYRQRNLPAPRGETRADLIAQLGHFKSGIERPFGMAMIGTVLEEENNTPDLLAQFREHLVKPRRAAFREILQAAQHRGELRPDAPIEIAINMLVGAYYAQYLAGQPFARSWIEQTVDTVLQGINK